MHVQQQTISRIWYLVPGTWYLVSNISYPIGFQDSSEESKKDCLKIQWTLMPPLTGLEDLGIAGPEYVYAWVPVIVSRASPV